MTPKKIRSADSDVKTPLGSRDAAANRQRILAMADEVFGAGGEAASTEEVARRASVGIATVFRHFPTKAALLEAVLVRRFAGLRDRADAAAQTAEPAQALFGFLADAIADAGTKLTIAGAYLSAGGDPTAGQAASQALREALGTLLERAQQHGGVRPDVDRDQLYALLIAASRAAALAEPEPGQGKELRDRIVAIVCRGLAATQKPPGYAGQSRTTS